MHRLSLFYCLLNVFLSLLGASSAAWAGGTAGVRGGGTGIQCANDPNPVMLEEYTLRELQKQNPDRIFALPRTRSEVKERLETGLRKEPTLLKQIESYWDVPSLSEKGIGEFASWPSAPSTVNSESELSILLREMVTAFRQFGRGWRIPKFDPAAMNGSALIQDDFGVVPVDCKKMQLSEIDESKVSRVYLETLSDVTQRIAELHEAIYLVGMILYGQTLPAETRKLVVALILGDAKELKKTVSHFVSVDRKEARSLLAFNRILLLTSVQGSPMPDDRHACPMALSLGYDGNEFQAVSLELKGDFQLPPAGVEYSSSLRFEAVVRHARPLRAPSLFKKAYDRVVSTNSNATMLENHPAILFPDDENPDFYPGKTKVLVQFAKAYRFYAGDRLAMEDFLNERLPKEKSGSRGYGIVDTDCMYSAWDSSEVGDVGMSVKLWNQILLNHR